MSEISYSNRFNLNTEIWSYTVKKNIVFSHEAAELWNIILFLQYLMQPNHINNNSPPVDNASQSTSSNNPQNKPSVAKSRKSIELNSVDQLTFENFFYTDMSNFSAKVVSITSKLIGPTVSFLFFLKH